MAKNTIKRIKTSNKHLETDYASAVRLLKEARAHFGAEMFGDVRYIGTEGWDDETVDQWFNEVDALIGPAFPGGGVQGLTGQNPQAVDPCEELFDALDGDDY